MKTADITPGRTYLEQTGRYGLPDILEVLKVETQAERKANIRREDEERARALGRPTPYYYRRTAEARRTVQVRQVGYVVTGGAPRIYDNPRDPYWVVPQKLNREFDIDAAFAYHAERQAKNEQRAIEREQRRQELADEARALNARLYAAGFLKGESAPVVRVEKDGLGAPVLRVRQLDVEELRDWLETL